MRIVFPLLEDLQEKFRNRVIFKVIYITEAHAQDTWPIRSSRGSKNGKPVLYNNPKDVQERIIIAKDFQRDFNSKIDILLDYTEKFEDLYSPWPLRFFIFMNNEIKFISLGHQWVHDLEENLNVLLEERNEEDEKVYL